MPDMKWFRCYNDIPNNPKIRLLAFEDRWHYIALLCAKSNGLLDKHEPLRTRLLQVHLGLSGVDFDNLRIRLTEVDLIDERWIPVGWDERQFQSDNSTERVREYRNRMKQEVKREGNVSVTPQETDTETDTDTEKKRERTQRATRLPADWMPSLENLEFCRQARPDLLPAEVADSFRDHWLGNGQTKKDWDATWRNWVRREKSRISPARARTQSWVAALAAPADGELL